MQRSLRRFTAGPWLGLRDSLDPITNRDPALASEIVNLYPLELDRPTPFVARPGLTQAGAQLGASGKRTGQWVGQFTKLDGTEYTVAVVGGQGVYTYNWSTAAWSNVVTVANLTTASITLSETARVYTVTFANTLVVSDGVNTPWTWDGTSGAGGLTKLTAAPVFFGQPTVYYAKLFGIKNTARSSIVWSEELDATTGYESGFTNVWTLGQTDQDALYAIVGTNEALYYFRAHSSGAISGAVNSEFATDGTREGLSETVGTTSPGGIVYHDARLFLVDALGRPHVARLGAGVAPVWQDAAETLRGVDRTALASVTATFDPTTGLVLYGMPETGQSSPTIALAYNPLRANPVAVWNGWPFTTIGVVKNGEGELVLMHIDSDGYAYRHGLPTSTLWDDELNAGTATVTHTLTTSYLAPDPQHEQRVSRVDVALRIEDGASSLSLVTETPYGNADAVTATVTGAGSRWGEFNWGEGQWAAYVSEGHAAFGVQQVGRWVRCRFTHAESGESVGLSAATVTSTAAGDRAGAL